MTSPGASPTDPAPLDFEALYAADPDPWDVATSFYERRKIDLVLATLRRPRYRFAWDAGCGTGDLAVGLAGRAEAVLATDASERACALTRRRAAAANVEVVRSALPARPIAEGTADLIVVSEVLYYLPAADRAAAYAAIDAAAAPDADVVAVHWVPRPEDAATSGERVQLDLDAHLAAAGWSRLVTHSDLEFALALWSRDVPSTVGR